MSGDRRGARLKRDANGRDADGLAPASQMRELGGLRQRQRWRRRRQSRVGHRHDGADRADVARAFIRVMIGRRLPLERDLCDLAGNGADEGALRQGRADFMSRRPSRGNRVEMTERQRELDDQRKERDPGPAFDIRPNPRHDEAHPASKGLRVKTLSTLLQVSRTRLNSVNGSDPSLARFRPLCGICATPCTICRHRSAMPCRSRCPASLHAWSLETLGASARN